MPTASPQNDGARNTARDTADVADMTDVSAATGISGAFGASGAPDVSMSRLLASCAAARAVSTPPPPPEPGRDAAEDDIRLPMLQDPRRTPTDTPEPRRREAA